MVVGPSLDAKEAVERFKKKHSLSIPLLVGAEDTATAYKVEFYPTLFLIGKDGLVKWKGFQKNEELIATLEKELKAVASAEGKEASSDKTEQNKKVDKSEGAANAEKK